MAVWDRLRYHACDSADDPDDYRPASRWAAAVDPAVADRPFVSGLCLFVDEVAPGDRVPLHTHPVDELIVLTEGVASFTLDDETKTLTKGAVVFAPAGTPHGARNLDSTPATFIGFFATERVGIAYLERNPAPGTERQEPQPLFELDVRAELDK